MKQLIQQIEQWAEDRNLIQGSTPEKQMLKLMEEFGELCGGIVKDKPEIIKDSIGDCFVVLTILNAQYRLKSTNLANSFPSAFLTPMKERHNVKSIDEAATMTFKCFSCCFMGDFEPMDWDIQRSVNSLQCIAEFANLDLKECVQYAYDQIKDRKGKMIKGVFVKEDDLK